MNTLRSDAASSHGLCGIPRQILNAIHQHKSHRQLRQQLMKLDDRILSDIGLTRTQIADLGDGLRRSTRRRH
jgi:uncharacterized protein YjiS (DUF1127 family)